MTKIDVYQTEKYIPLSLATEINKTVRFFQKNEFTEPKYTDQIYIQALQSLANLGFGDDTEQNKYIGELYVNAKEILEYATSDSIAKETRKSQIIKYQTKAFPPELIYAILRAETSSYTRGLPANLIHNKTIEPTTQDLTNTLRLLLNTQIEKWGTQAVSQLYVATSTESPQYQKLENYYANSKNIPYRYIADTTLNQIRSALYLICDKNCKECPLLLTGNPISQWTCILTLDSDITYFLQPCSYDKKVNINSITTFQR